MASIIKSNTYADFNGREILTADNNGNLTTQKVNGPALKVRLNSSQTGVTSATYTKVEFDTEDTNVTTSGTWDSTNYRWTPGLAGKYYLSLNLEVFPASDTAKQWLAVIYKNGSSLTYAYLNMNAFDLRSQGSQALGVSLVDYANSTDYYEGYVYMQANSGTVTVRATNDNTNFCGFRIGS
jgi:hypothetical protein